MSLQIWTSQTPLVVSLEDRDAICAIAKMMLNHPERGLKANALNKQEISLMTAFGTLLNNCPETSREQWARMQEACLLHLGNPVATTIEQLCSALRTPTLAESALRAAGQALIEVNKRRAEWGAKEFMRELFAQAINP